MELILKRRGLLDKAFKNVCGVFVRVNRVEDKGIWYYVLFEYYDASFHITTDYAGVSQDVGEALDLQDRIRAALDSGVGRLEVSV